MKTTVLFAIATLAFITANTAEAAKAHKVVSHKAHAGKMTTACKGEFMYSKGGKCMDARDKAT